MFVGKAKFKGKSFHTWAEENGYVPEEVVQSKIISGMTVVNTVILKSKKGKFKVRVKYDGETMEWTVVRI